MIPFEYYVVVFLAGLVTALSTGVGALVLSDDVSDRYLVALWGLAAGIILSASIFGLIFEALETGEYGLVGVGLLAGVGIVVLVDRLITAHEFQPRTIAKGDFEKLALIFGVLTIHSFPEGIAVGVAFAELGTSGDLVLAGIAIPALAVFVSIAVSIMNVPEGLAIAIPFRTYGIGRWQTVGWAIASSLPQPVGAVLAYAFVTTATGLLPLGFGFAAGAMLYLVVNDIVPEAIGLARKLPGGGYGELLAGLVVGVIAMTPLLVVFG